MLPKSLIPRSVTIDHLVPASTGRGRLALAAKGGVIDPVTAADTHRALDAVWRSESAKLIAGLTRIVRDVGIAEDLAQDALLAALEQWPESEVPRNPGAWL